MPMWFSISTCSSARQTSAADELLHALVGNAEELSRVPEADAKVVDEDTSRTGGRGAGLDSLFLGPPPIRAARTNGGLHVRR